MWPFKKKDRSSMVLITISSSAVSGAYAHYELHSTPVVCYTVRHLIVQRDGEDLRTAMLRTLDAVGTDLIEVGSSALRRETGSGSVDGVLISVAAPWQETNVRTETVQPGKPFVFTHAVLSEVIASGPKIAEDRICSSEAVIATILNGYDIPDAIGKKANRAEVVILSSTIDKAVTEEVRTRVRKLYHTHTISFTAFAPVTYSVLRDLYPHERDFLALDVAAVDTDLVFVKGGLLVDVGTVPLGLNDLLAATRTAERMTVEEESGVQTQTSLQPGYVNSDHNARFSIRADAARDEWLKGLTDLLKKFAQLHALPRTLFVLAQPNSREYLKRALNSNILHALWLSDEPLCVITVTSEQFTSKIQSKTGNEIPIFIAILTLYQQKQLQK